MVVPGGSMNARGFRECWSVTMFFDPVPSAMCFACPACWSMSVPGEGKGKGKVLGRSPNSSVSVIPTCPKAQHATSYYTHQNSCTSGTVNSRET